MTPFDFIITLLSFVYSLALAHVLGGVGALVRRRRTIIWSAPHAVWLANVVAYIIVNWLALWDFRQLKVMSLDMIALGTSYAIVLYLMAVFVTPDADDDDLAKFHARERRTYAGATLVLTIVSLGLNLAAGSAGIANWAEQNILVVTSVPMLVAAMWTRKVWLDLAAALGLLFLLIAYAVLYYPALKVPG